MHIDTFQTDFFLDFYAWVTPRNRPWIYNMWSFDKDDPFDVLYRTHPWYQWYKYGTFLGYNKLMPQRYTEVNLEVFRLLGVGRYWVELDPEPLLNTRVSAYMKWYDNFIDI